MFVARWKKPKASASVNDFATMLNKQSQFNETSECDASSIGHRAVHI